MSLKHFPWVCLVLAGLPLVYQLVAGLGEDRTAASLFSATMIVMAVGFGLVRRELAARP